LPKSKRRFTFCGFVKHVGRIATQRCFRSRSGPAKEIRFTTSSGRIFMAKKSWIQKELRKRKTVARLATKRAELKAAGDYAGLASLPRDSSRTRLVNRCRVTGRRRAYMSKFQVSRITFRELASQGNFPGSSKPVGKLPPDYFKFIPPAEHLFPGGFFMEERILCSKTISG